MARFEKGNSGGPGRPRGGRNAINLTLDRLASGDAERLVGKMIETALDGNCAAARMVLNRVWSPPRGRPIQIDLPEIAKPADLIGAHSAVLAALTAGTISAEEASSIASVLDTHRRAFELADHETRVTNMEAEFRQIRKDLTYK